MMQIHCNSNSLQELNMTSCYSWYGCVCTCVWCSQ